MPATEEYQVPLDQDEVIDIEGRILQSPHKGTSNPACHGGEPEFSSVVKTEHDHDDANKTAGHSSR